MYTNVSTKANVFKTILVISLMAWCVYNITKTRFIKSAIFTFYTYFLGVIL